MFRLILNYLPARCPHNQSPISVFIFRVICEDGSGRSVSDFLCRNNIFLFLRASVFHFELADSQIFSPEDLYLCQDIAKVFKTLSVLSHSPKVQRSGVPGFPKKEKNLSKRLKSEKSNYEALGNLQIFVSPKFH